MHEKLTSKQILGRRVRQERKERGWTQTQLSEMINKTTETVCHIENGNAATKLKTVDMLAEIFGIEPYELFQEKNTFNFEKVSGVRLELLQELEETDDEAVALVLNLIQKMKKK